MRSDTKLPQSFASWSNSHAIFDILKFFTSRHQFCQLNHCVNDCTGICTIPRFGLFSIQILTWIAILIALYWIFQWAWSLESYLLRLPAMLSRCMAFAAGITLQIYLVQFPIIERFEGLFFPLNLLIITVIIIAAAVVVYLIDHVIQKGIDRIFH